MLQFLEIVSKSWPIAAMFVAACALVGGLAIVHAVRAGRREDRAFRAEQAREVTAKRYQDAG
jgi:hypothetical protein